jgi:hypothetical protein
MNRDRTLSWLFGLSVVIGVIDIIVTGVFLSRGYSEGNPIFAHTIKHLGLKIALLLNLFTTYMSCFIIYRAGIEEQKAKNKDRIIVIFTVLVMARAFAVATWVDNFLWEFTP